MNCVSLLIILFNIPVTVHGLRTVFFPNSLEKRPSAFRFYHKDTELQQAHRKTREKLSVKHTSWLCLQNKNTPISHITTQSHSVTTHVSSCPNTSQWKCIIIQSTHNITCFNGRLGKLSFIY